MIAPWRKETCSESSAAISQRSVASGGGHKKSLRWCSASTAPTWAGWNEGSEISPCADSSVLQADSNWTPSPFSNTTDENGCRESVGKTTVKNPVRYGSFAEVERASHICTADKMRSRLSSTVVIARPPRLERPWRISLARHVWKDKSVPGVRPIHQLFGWHVSAPEALQPDRDAAVM